MVTFCVIVVSFLVLLVVAAGGIVALGSVLGGVLLIVLDVLIGIAPFVGLFLLIRWLFSKR